MGQQSAALCLSIVHVSQIKSITYVILNGREEREGEAWSFSYSARNMFLTLSMAICWWDFIFNVNVPFFSHAY